MYTELPSKWEVKRKKVIDCGLEIFITEEKGKRVLVKKRQCRKKTST